MVDRVKYLCSLFQLTHRNNVMQKLRNQNKEMTDAVRVLKAVTYEKVFLTKFPVASFPCSCCKRTVGMFFLDSHKSPCSKTGMPIFEQGNLSRKNMASIEIWLCAWFDMEKLLMASKIITTQPHTTVHFFSAWDLALIELILMASSVHALYGQRNFRDLSQISFAEQWLILMLRPFGPPHSSWTVFARHG